MCVYIYIYIYLYLYLYLSIYLSVYLYIYIYGIPGGSVVKNPPAKEEMQVLSLSQ